MADVLKVLGQAAPANTTDVTLYFVPDTTVATTSSLVVCNRTGGSLTFRVAIRVADAPLENKQYLYYDKAVAANDSHVAVLGMTLNQLDSVSVRASADGLSFNLFGVETS